MFSANSIFPMCRTRIMTKMERKGKERKNEIRLGVH